MVGAANSDSARISFFGSTKGELAQKLDRGQDAVGRRRLTQVPPEPREMVAYYTAHELCLGRGYLLFVGGPAHPYYTKPPPNSLKGCCLITKEIFY